MAPENNKSEQDAKLEQMNYNPENDIFNMQEKIPLDGDGNPVLNEDNTQKSSDDGLDIPGTTADDEMEIIGSEDEENNYYSLSDNEDNHEETNDDVLG